MVGGDHVNGTIFQSFNQCLPVLLCAERRVHLGHGPVLGHRFFGEGKVVGGDFRRHMGPQAFGQTHHGHGVFGADVLNIHFGSGIQGQHTIPGHQRVLRHGRRAENSQAFRGFAPVDAVFADKGRVLFMEAQGFVQLSSPLHGFAAQAAVQERNAVVGESRRSGLAQCFQIGKLFSRHALGDAGGREHMDAGLFPLFPHILKRLHIVHRGLGIGHGDHRGKAALLGGLRPGLDGLLVGLSRIAEVDMHIDQPRGHAQSPGVDDRLPFLFRQTISHGGHLPLLQEDVHHLIQSAVRTQHSGPFDSQHTRFRLSLFFGIDSKKDTLDSVSFLGGEGGI